MRPFTFPKNRRLLNKQQVQGVFDNVDCKQGSKYFTFLSCKNQLAVSRLGIIVAKRHVKTAVGRNAIKRRVRNTFRLTLPVNAAGPEPFDVLVIARPDCANLPREKITAELNRQWAKLIQKRQSRHAAAATPTQP
ncbi:MAG: ribonuclease P protein component [Pseudomonadales bacterium]